MMTFVLASHNDAIKNGHWKEALIDSAKSVGWGVVWAVTKVFDMVLTSWGHRACLSSADRRTTQSNSSIRVGQIRILGYENTFKILWIHLNILEFTQIFLNYLTLEMWKANHTSVIGHTNGWSYDRMAHWASWQRWLWLKDRALVTKTRMNV